ncbi:LysE family transporter [Paenibacillus sp. PDC88]|uniref:LysE family transporter n=1 Tax=Paenibacillus sp. PDC88 TaxID=1884375 RepID=UPI00089ACBFD|nr:LysE family transporter [Paenibacillus sp. PDC88]SDW74263.1 Threonine/homoserine/homoserine lactone efflux protein [Paenibacillus sp. PDC88]
MLTSAYIAYMLLGLSLAAPIGPLNAAQLNIGIRRGFFHSWVFGLGAVLADVVYMLLVYLGVVHFLDTPFVQTFLWLFGFFVLVYTGVESLLSSGQIKESHTSEKEPLGRSFRAGFWMSLFNPMSILFWLGIFGSVLAQETAAKSTSQIVLLSLAIVAGILVWDFTVAATSSFFRKVLSKTLLRGISIISGLFLIGFGIHFGLQAVKVLFF